MNFYKRYIGDIQRDTGHLSLAEFGAYDRLLDHYYATEQKLPGDIDACCRIARAMTKDERKAVELVLSQFFSLEDGGYSQARAEIEITEAQPAMVAARTNGAKGGRPRKSQTETQEKPNGFSGVTQREPRSKPHQTPDPEPDNSVVESGSTHTEIYSEHGSPACVATPAGAVCKRVIELGIDPTTCNPGNPTLQALLDSGATMAEFEGAALSAAAKSKPFNYVIGTVKRQREEAAKLVLHQGKMPNKQEALEGGNRAVAETWVPPELKTGTGGAA